MSKHRRVGPVRWVTEWRRRNLDAAIFSESIQFHLVLQKPLGDPLNGKNRSKPREQFSSVVVFELLSGNDSLLNICQVLTKLLQPHEITDPSTRNHYI
jgi:hypothetical protein